MLTPREIETLRRRGIFLRRLGWALTIPVGLLLQLLVPVSFDDFNRDLTPGLIAFAVGVVSILGWARILTASHRLRSVRPGAEVIEHETVSGAVESVLLPAALVIQHEKKSVTFPRPIAVKHIAYVPEAILSARQELASSQSVRGERPLADAEIRELERIRDSSVRPVHRMVAIVYTAAHIPFLSVIFYYDAADLCLLFTLMTLGAGLLALFYSPLRRRAQAKKALLNGKVTVVSREVKGYDLELLPRSNTPWTQNSQPARWRYD